eukprot:891839-Amphidinium_carterae.1
MQGAERFALALIADDREAAVNIITGGCVLADCSRALQRTGDAEAMSCRSLVAKVKEVVLCRPAVASCIHQVYLPTICRDRYRRQRLCILQRLLRHPQQVLCLAVVHRSRQTSRNDHKHLLWRHDDDDDNDLDDDADDDDDDDDDTGSSPRERFQQSCNVACLADMWFVCGSA